MKPFAGVKMGEATTIIPAPSGYRGTCGEATITAISEPSELMMVVLILPLNVAAGQSCGQVIAFSFPAQIASPQRDAGVSPGVPVEARWLQEARMNKQLRVRIRNRLMVVSTCKRSGNPAVFAGKSYLSFGEFLL
jgi:hypothetical protein